MTLDKPLPKEIVHTEAGHFARVQIGTAPFEYEWEEIEPETFEAYIEAGVKVVKLNTQNQ